MPISEKQDPGTRLGFYYLPDTVNYGMHAAQLWAGELKKAGANWLLLQAPTERAIPETFLSPLVEAGIHPVLHFNQPLDSTNSSEDYRVLLNHYARQGAKYAIFYDRPNTRQKWTASVWAQEDLVERFLDQFLPLAELALYEELVPVFPVLEPGGDYWDLAFIRTALKSLLRRANRRLINGIVLAVNSQAGNRPLDWGAGGLDRWPGVRPYQSEPGIQDHRGFRTFDWYSDICYQELGVTLPIFLMNAGSKVGDSQDEHYPAVDSQGMLERNLEIIRWLHHDPDVHALSGKAPADILACFFDVMDNDLSPADAGSFNPKQPFLIEMRRWAASYRGEISQISEDEIESPNNTKKMIATAFASKSLNTENQSELMIDETENLDVNHQTMFSNSSQSKPASASEQSIEPLFPEIEIPETDQSEATQPISHYVLLPLYAWGAAEWDMELIAPIIQEKHATIGFSLTEAAMADRVTVVGGTEVYSDQALEVLRKSGCIVERLLPDGTLVATQ